MAPSAPPPPPPRLLVPKPDPDAPPQIPLTPDLRRDSAKPDPDAPAAQDATTPLTSDLCAALAAQDGKTPLTAELCAALRRELEPSPDDHSDFANRLRLTQHRLDHISARLSSAPPPPQPPLPLPSPPPQQRLPSQPPRPRADPKPASSPPPPQQRADPKPAPSPPPQIANPARARAFASTASASTMGRKRYRGMPSAEMVRATLPADTDLLQVRTVTRRARLTFEALRGHFHRRAASERSHRGRNRADMRALSAMLSHNLCLYRDKRIVGPVPGVFVGDAFGYRAELNVVGLHNHTQAAVGYVPASIVSEGHPVATSIVSSGEYIHDDRGNGNGDVLVYTGSLADQAFERGNLALAYSCKYGLEVRVIRCHDSDASPSGKVYLYDGLYKVESSTYGESGRQACRFKLVRLPGQDALATNVWSLARELTAALDANIRPQGYLTLDLARGKDTIRVPVCNTVDQDRSPLDDTQYIARPRLPRSMVPRAPRLVGRRKCCIYSSTACGGKSSSSSSCACVRRNGGSGPAYNADGTLVRGMPVVYECGHQCGCPASCPNRATQRGMRHRLEVIRSRATGWGVRTLDLIQPGAFICEFSGDVVAVDDANAGASTSWDGYVDPRKFPPRWKEWGDASAAALPDDNNGPPVFPECPTPAYVLDVSQRRNYAPYICHSAAPNAFVQLVVRGGEDESCPHLMVFALETIPPMRDLTIDYGIDQ